MPCVGRPGPQRLRRRDGACQPPVARSPWLPTGMATLSYVVLFSSHSTRCQPALDPASFPSVALVAFRNQTAHLVASSRPKQQDLRTLIRPSLMQGSEN